MSDALNAIQHKGRAARCRICTLIEQLEEPHASALARTAAQSSGVGLVELSDTLADEGYPGLYHSIKHHRYVCQRP